MQISRKRDFGLVKASLLVVLMLVGHALSVEAGGGTLNAGPTILNAFKFC